MQQKIAFQEYKISDDLRKALSHMGYEEPTKVQEAVIPAALESKDLYVKAKTGSGKTLAYGIPICERIDWMLRRPQALILVPTRELAVQVGEELSLIGKLKRLKVSTIFGKMPIASQELELKQKTHIVVGTPGRVLDLIERGSLKLEEMRSLVIDEADEMFFIGLREQVEAIVKYLPKERSTMLFSATLDKEVIGLTKRYMTDPVKIEMTEEQEDAPSIEQSAYEVEERDKFQLLKSVLLIKNPDSCMIFANTQEAVDLMNRKMSEEGFPCRKLHGGMKQRDRLKVMDQFKRKMFRYLIVTDVAARGIDIQQVSLVINYDMTQGTANYTHRIGRTGRNGEQGEAITFYTNREAWRLKEVEEKTGQIIQLLEGDPMKELEKDDFEYAKKKLEFEQKLRTKPEQEEKKGQELRREVMKLHINAGKKSKIRTCEIVASICGIDGVSVGDIGVIQITETATFVEILNRKGNLVLKELPKKTIKGRNRKVNKARAELK